MPYVSLVFQYQLFEVINSSAVPIVRGVNSYMLLSLIEYNKRRAST